MKSFAHRSLSPKRVKKLAAGYTDEEMRASFGAGLERSYVMEVLGGGAVVGCWTDHGPIELLNDDDVLNYAQVEFLRRNGYPVFRSDAELDAHARERGWPGRKQK
jgi:hypothetical protein